MKDVVTHGKAGTAMMGFAKLLTENDIDSVIAFIQQAFIRGKKENTRYHTAENGWFNHEKYQDAFPFVSGELAIDDPWEELTDQQKLGKRLYLSSCISCHDHGKVRNTEQIWRSFPLSWPRNGYSHKQRKAIDDLSHASPYAVHEKKSAYTPKNKLQALGEQIFDKNCVFCHAADGSGKNWVGQFLQPQARNFTTQPLQEMFTKETLSQKIANGVNGSAMPAWRYVLNEKQITAIVEYMWDRFN